MDQANKNEFEPFNDEWLTRALRARSQAETRPGLEERILAHLTSEQVSQPQRRWRWMPALAVAFGLLLIVLIGREVLRVGPRTQNGRAKKVQPQQLRPVSPVSEVPRAEVSKARSRTTEHFSRAHTRNPVSPVVAKANALPKLDKFPAETPATEQESLMIEMQRIQSAAALAQYARDFHAIKDLEIEKISIAPILPETAEAEPNR